MPKTKSTQHRHSKEIFTILEDPKLDINNVNDTIEKLKTFQTDGYSFNIRDNNQKTPLHIAVELKLLPLINFLLTIPNINVNAQDKEKNTPLHCLCKMPGDQTLNLLLQALLAHKDIRIDIGNKQNYTPPEIARNQGNINLCTNINDHLIRQNDLPYGELKTWGDKRSIFNGEAFEFFNNIEELELDNDDNNKTNGNSNTSKLFNFDPF